MLATCHAMDARNRTLLDPIAVFYLFLWQILTPNSDNFSAISDQHVRVFFRLVSIVFLNHWGSEIGCLLLKNHGFGLRNVAKTKYSQKAEDYRSLHQFPVICGRLGN